MTYLVLYHSPQTLSENLRKEHTYANHEPLGLQLLFYPINTKENSNQLHRSALDLGLSNMSIKFINFHLLRVSSVRRKCTSGYQLHKQNEHIFSEVMPHPSSRAEMKNLFQKKVL